MYPLVIRSSLDWILDQHKEKAVDLLMRVSRISVETVAITNAIRALER